MTRTRAKAGLAERIKSWVKRNASVLRLQRANRQLRREVAALQAQLDSQREAAPETEHEREGAPGFTAWDV